MNQIVRKKILNSSVTLMEISAPLEAAKAEPGQFVILRTDADGERIPLTISNSGSHNLQAEPAEGRGYAA